ncbi:MAG: hypothetical protein R3B93_15340 [Bacteroidia bacterium]
MFLSFSLKVKTFQCHDMQFSPDGDLYMLGDSRGSRGNENAQVKRIQYNGGNRMPVVHAECG